MSPTKPPHRCAHCHQLTTGKCPTCQPPWHQANTAWQTTTRTNNPQWRRIRNNQLQQHPQCENCGQLATQADHLDGTNYQDNTGTGTSWLNPNMIRSLCRTCHNHRTAQQGATARWRAGASTSPTNPNN